MGVDEPRIVLGVPHVGPLPGYFFDTVLGLVRPDTSQVIRVENKPVDIARSLIVEAFLRTDSTHLFFMDADMKFPGEALYRLISRGKPVVSGTYYARTKTPIPHLYRFSHEGRFAQHLNKGPEGRWYTSVGKQLAEYFKAHPEFQNSATPVVLPDTDDALATVDVTGGGCLLIEREVLEAMRTHWPDERFPWFRNHPESAGGEDFFFGERVAELGYEIWADFSVQCEHEFPSEFIAAPTFITAFGVGTEDERNWDAATELVSAQGDLSAHVPKEYDDGWIWPGDVRGYMTEDEGRYLYELALAQKDKPGVVVELGSFEGLSAICMAQAGAGDLHLVDHGSGEQFYDPRGVAFESHKGGTYWQTLVSNLGRYADQIDHGAGEITLHEKDTAMAGREWDGLPVKLLFIDAAHDFESCKADFESWEPHLTPDAIVAFDDAHFAGVRPVIELVRQRGWEVIGVKDSVAALRRKQEV